MEWLDIILLIIAGLSIPVGIIFSVLPPLPGPLVAWLGVLCMRFTSVEDKVSVFWLVLLGVVAGVVTVIDYYLPVAATKKYGGTKTGIWGGAIGTIVGALFLPGWGILVGPLVGAIVGDLIGGNQFKAALRSGFGSFMGFLLATFLKVLVSIVMGIFVVFDIIRLIPQIF